MNPAAPRLLQRPTIDPVPEGIARPFWSVMIPSYKRVKYLQDTLRSVLRQDPGPERMQIEVVDNCSPGTEVESLVQRVGQGRIQFFRHPQNLGMVNNWNACIHRSIGQWVHILHDDDEVCPGFYAAYENLIAQSPAAVLGGGAALLMNEAGVVHGISHNIFWTQPGVIPDFLSHSAMQMQFASTSVVARRSAYEAVGGFSTDLRFAPDWEMTFRLAMHGQVIGTTRPYCLYRQHNANVTSELTGSDLAIKEQIFLVDQHCRS